MPRSHRSNIFKAFYLSAVLAVAVAACPTLHAQTAATTAAQAYDVAAIKPSKAVGPGRIGFDDNGTFSATNVNVNLLIQLAFHMRRDLVLNVPKWAQEEHFDIQAKMVDGEVKSDPSLTQEQRDDLQLLKLQSLLIDRFHLKMHKETRIMQIYELAVGKNGIKMTPVDTPEDGPSNIRGGAGTVSAQAIPMDFFAQALSNYLSDVVVNKTGLTGRYDFTLKWSPDETKPIDDAPSIFTAVQEQLGLKLQPVKAPVEVLVVDSVEHPTEN
jgi:uncharacterized protein (TIGR03435 family)